MSKAELRSETMPGILNQLQMGRFEAELMYFQQILTQTESNQDKLNLILVGHAELCLQCYYSLISVVDVRTVVSETQQTRDMAELSYNVNTIFHPVAAAS